MKVFICLYRGNIIYHRKYYFRKAYALKYKEKLEKQGKLCTIIETSIN